MDNSSQPDNNPVREERAEHEEQLPLWPTGGPAAAGEPKDSIDGSTPATPLVGPVSSITPSPAPTSVEPPWRVSDLGLFIVFAVLAFFFANAVALGLVALYHNGMSNGSELDPVLTATPFVVLMQVIWESLWLVFIYYTVTRKYRRPFWPSIRWRTALPGPKTYLFAGIVLAVVVQVVFSLFPSQENLPIDRMFSSPASGYLLAVFGIGVAPFMEELVFRGFFYPVIERVWGFTAAVLLTALLFAVMHAPQLNGELTAMAAIYCVGLALSYARGRTGSMRASYLMHLGYNTTLFVLLYVTTDRFRALQV